MNGSVKDSRSNVEEEEEEEEDVYDGDENHKVWAGSQERLDEGPYDLYGTGSRGKTPRPRQVSRPAPVPPPPPPPPVTVSTNKKQKKSQRRSNSTTNLRDDGARTLGPPRGQHPPWAQRPGAYAATLPPPRLRPQYATVEPRPLRAARSLAALDAPHLGAAARRGHLNERAFSYSIRQEHRARSHASLASLKFAAPPDVSDTFILQ